MTKKEHNNSNDKDDFNENILKKKYKNTSNFLGQIFKYVIKLFKNFIRIDNLKDNVRIIILIILIILVLIPAILLLQFIYDKKVKAKEFDLENLFKIDVASIVYDKNGKELNTISFTNRRTVSIENIPYRMIKTIIAAEDSRFFEHKGVDYIGICRAILGNIKSMGVSQGASTITQQLARNTYELGGRNFSRKLIEAFLANRIEKKLSKSQILEHYFNRIYFGKNFYGLGTASLGYFGKSIKELTLSECAIICGLIKSPVNYNPIDHPNKAKIVRNYVLRRMYNEKLISNKEYEEAKSEKITINPRKKTMNKNYVLDIIQKEAIKYVGPNKIRIGGYRIYTSLDVDLQKKSEELLQKHLFHFEINKEDYKHQTYRKYSEKLSFFENEIKQKKIDPTKVRRPTPQYLQGSLIILENKTGNIISFVGGRDFYHSQYNRAEEAKIKPGTAFTPFVYAAAYNKKEFFPGSLLKDTPLNNRFIMVGGLKGTLGEWGVEVYNNKFEQDITAFESLSKGKNSATVRLGKKIGLEYIKNLAKKAGINTDKYKYSKALLGENLLNLKEISLAYTIFPNDGYRPSEISIITKIEDIDGQEIYTKNENKLIKVIDNIAAKQVHSSLNDSIKNGSAAKATTQYGLKDLNVGVKTGTSYNYKDLMIVGYNNQFTCGIWSGFDLPKTIHHETFSNEVILPAWVNIMNFIEEKYPAKKITNASNNTNEKKIELCKKSGEIATNSCFEKEKITNQTIINDYQNNNKIKNIKWKLSRSTFTTYIKKYDNYIRKCSIHYEGNDDSKFKPIETNRFILQNAFKPNISIANSIFVKSPTLIGGDPYGTVTQTLINENQNKNFLTEIKENELGEEDENEDEEKNDNDEKKTQEQINLNNNYLNSPIDISPPGPLDFEEILRQNKNYQ